MTGALRHAPLILAVAAAVYFIAHGADRPGGLAGWSSYKGQISRLEAEVASLTAERAHLEDRAMRLREATLDLDYLEERARASLMLARAGDLIIPAASLNVRR